ncbi:SAVED domain-containing protein [Spongiibacter marinus]|uniref:SAVED domain-containing protein n=1 Tax=Spongiibacter marinus TaxID=354246 RepID=UPI0013790215|nr:SAVED domain-containing protein [Spongiibacter marinus]
MKSVDDYIEIALRLTFRSITGKVGYCLAIAGLYLISPPIVIDLINLFLAKTSFGQLSASEPMPVTGTSIVSFGTLLILVNHFWAPRQQNREVIGIRHNSLGSFPQEAVQKDLPVLQRLAAYREIDVDHSDSYTKGVLDDHETAIRRLDRVPHQLSGFLSSGADSPIAYYGLPHVPLAFYLGYLLSDSKYRVDLYDLNNDSGRWDQLSGITRAIDLFTKIDCVESSDASGDVVVAIGISYPIHPTEIAELGLSSILATAEINARQPTRQLITSHDQIAQVCTEFRKTLEVIKNKFPNRRRIHVFYAGPVSLSFALGRCISERIDPEIIVYNYSSQSIPKYAWSLSFNNPDHPSARFNAHHAAGGSHAPVQHA